MKKWFYWASLSATALMTACSKMPELEAPCHQFGKYCAQSPVNISPIREDFR